MKNKTSFKEKSPAELNKALSAKREELKALRFSAAGSRPKDTNGAKKARKEIARALTELSSRTA